MTEHAQPPAQVVNGEEIAWTAHPRFSDILMKQMLTSVANPLASVSRVRVPPGGVIGWHQHAAQTETVYVLTGDSTGLWANPRFLSPPARLSRSRRPSVTPSSTTAPRRWSCSAFSRRRWGDEGRMTKDEGRGAKPDS